MKLDVPPALLEEPSLESGRIKQDCEWFVEEFENELEDWFLNNRQSSLRVRVSLTPTVAQPCGAM